MNAALVKTLSVATLVTVMLANANAQFSGKDKVPPKEQPETQPIIGEPTPQPPPVDPKTIVAPQPAAPEPQPPAPAAPPATGQAQLLNGCLMGRETFYLSPDLKQGFQTWQFKAESVGNAAQAHYLTFGSLGLLLDTSQPTQSPVGDVPPWWNTIRDTLHSAAISNTMIGVQSDSNAKVLSLWVAWGTPCPYSSGY